MYTNDELEEALERAIALMRDMRAYAEETLQLWDKDKDTKVGKRLRAMAGDLRGYDSVTTDFNDFLDREGWRSD
jgi:uncharacterized membrane protein YdfJ with MMPL/SSD domain